MTIIENKAAPAGTVVHTDFPESMQNAIAMGIPAISRHHEDYVPLRLTVMALGGYFGSRLMTNIREEKGLTYGIGAALMGGHEGSHAYISAKCDSNFTDKVISEIKAELVRLASDPPRGEELERLRMHAYVSLLEILDTPKSIMDYYRTMLIAGTPADYLERQLKGITGLSSDVISEMASKYLRPELLRTSIAGPSK